MTLHVDGLQELKSRRASKRLRRESGFIGISNQNVGIQRPPNVSDLKEEISTLELAMLEFLTDFYVFDDTFDPSMGSLGFLVGMSHTKTSLGLDIDDLKERLSQTKLLQDPSITTELNRRLDLLKCWLELHASIQEFDSLSSQPEVETAASTCVKIKQLRSQIQLSAGEINTFALGQSQTESILNGMSQLFGPAEASFRVRLKKCLHHGIACVRPGSANVEKLVFSLKIRSQISQESEIFNGVPSLEQIITAMAVLGILNDCFKGLIECIVTSGVLPMVKDYRNVQLCINETELYNELVISLVEQPAGELGRLWDHHIKTLLNFLSDNLIVSSEPGVSQQREILHEFLWLPLANSLVENYLMPALPSDPSQLPQFLQSHQFILEIQETAKKLQFCPEKSSILSNFLREADQLLSMREAFELLESSKEILLDSTPQVERVSTDLERGGLSAFMGCKASGKMSKSSTFFKLEERYISAQVHAIVERLYQLVEPPGSPISSSDVASKVYFQVRDVLSLTVSILSFRVEHPSEPTMDSILQLSEQVMLLYNNCEYVQYHMITLLHSLRPKMTEPLATMASLDDLFVNFRSLGHDTMVQFLVSIQAHLNTKCFLPLLEQVDQPDLEDSVFLDLVQVMERNVKKVFSKLKTAWSKIAPKPFFLQLMSQCIDELLPLFLHIYSSLRKSGGEYHANVFKLSMQSLNDGIIDSISVSFSGTPKSANIWDSSGATTRTEEEKFLQESVKDYKEFQETFLTDFVI